MRLGKRYGARLQDDVSFKIMLDVLRTVTLLIGDGLRCSNEGRGYVLRRLIWRAVLNGKKLGMYVDFLYVLGSVVGEMLKSYYPQILANQPFI